MLWNQASAMRDQFSLGTAVIAVTLALVSGASGQEKYPVRPIQLVVPFAAGGSTDVIGRRVAAKLGPLLGATVVVENRPGASGTIGAGLVARANADGYTILLGSDQVVATGALQNLTYDGIRDFAPLSLLTVTPVALLAGPAMPAKDVQELIALLKSQPAKHSYGSPGEGSIINLAGEMFKRVSGTDMVHVPYRGAAPAMNDLIGGHIPLMVGTVGTSIEQVRSGKVRMLLTFSDKRLPLTPDVPSASEIGFPNLIISSFSGLFVHKDTPQDVVKTLREAAERVVRDPEFRASMETIGIQAVNDTSPAAAIKLVKESSDNFISIFNTNGIKVD
jgi:tripartite-type tricarboxylate transporter receptor subunit TctC